LKILCTADIHMGRRPSRLPAHIDTAPLSSTRCWDAIVETAIAERVQLVALAGDVVDQANRYYEAVGPFEAGLKRLAAKGIRVVAVAGNHDHETLVAIAANFRPEIFTLLGRGGAWERLTIERGGRPALHVDGWSFPRATHTEDPLREYAPPPPDGVPVLGLLHGDLDVAGSRYAPVRLADLGSHRHALWLLGHIHLPARREMGDGTHVLYPGSPQALDPGERGWHGVWLAELGDTGRFELREVALSTVRYEALDVDLTGADSMSEVDARLSNEVRAYLGRVVDDGAGPLRYLSLRIRLTGRTALHRELGARVSGIATELELEESGVRVLVERVSVATSPALDLEEIARGQDAPGIVARLALAIDAGSLDAEQEALLRRAVRAGGAVHEARSYRAISNGASEGVSEDEARWILRDHALLLLDSLVAQKEVA
jgi:DNA repair protein SbcD/Mre11